MREIDVDGIGESTLRSILGQYAPRIVPGRAEILAHTNGFSGAKIWRVATPDGDFALRRWPDPGMPRLRILGLHRLLDHLRNAGLSIVAVPWKTNDGTTLPHDFGSDWQLEPWMPGYADFRSVPSQNRLRAAMAALAQWHLAASWFIPPESASQWFSSHRVGESPAVGERLTLLESATQGSLSRVETGIASQQDVVVRDQSSRILELFRCGRDQALAELRLVRGVTVRLQPVLRDVWHDHLLFVGDNVTGLIDPSACRTESVACDLSRLIGSLVGDDSTATEFALEEYQRFRPLSTGERALIAVLDRSGVLLSGWTWLEWLYLEHRSFPDPGVVSRRLMEIQSRMEHVVNGPRPGQKLIVP